MSGKSDWLGGMQDPDTYPAAPPTGSVHDFGFFVGDWDVRHRRLAKWLAGSDDWDEFGSTTRCWQLFGGAANLDEIKVPERGFTGASLRLFDPVASTWSIYWANSKYGQLQLPPVVGGFSDGTGLFYARDQHDGKPVAVRYIWSGITDHSARWEQAFSPDDGQTWEVNWIMDFSRRD
jgi:hypothetical protein